MTLRSREPATFCSKVPLSCGTKYFKQLLSYGTPNISQVPSCPLRFLPCDSRCRCRQWPWDCEIRPGVSSSWATWLWAYGTYHTPPAAHWRRAPGGWHDGMLDMQCSGLHCVSYARSERPRGRLSIAPRASVPCSHSVIQQWVRLSEQAVFPLATRSHLLATWWTALGQLVQMAPTDLLRWISTAG